MPVRKYGRVFAEFCHDAPLSFVPCLVEVEICELSYHRITIQSMGISRGPSQGRSSFPENIEKLSTQENHFLQAIGRRPRFNWGKLRKRIRKRYFRIPSRHLEGACNFV